MLALIIEMSVQILSSGSNSRDKEGKAEGNAVFPAMN